MHRCLVTIFQEKLGVAAQALLPPGPLQLEPVGTHLMDRNGHGAHKARRDPRTRRAAIAGTVKGRQGRRKRLFGWGAGHMVGGLSDRSSHCAVCRQRHAATEINTPSKSLPSPEPGFWSQGGQLGSVLTLPALDTYQLKGLKAKLFLFSAAFLFMEAVIFETLELLCNNDVSCGSSKWTQIQTHRSFHEAFFGNIEN